MHINLHMCKHDSQHMIMTFHLPSYLQAWIFFVFFQMKEAVLICIAWFESVNICERFALHILLCVRYLCHWERRKWSQSRRHRDLMPWCFGRGEKHAADVPCDLLWQIWWDLWNFQNFEEREDLRAASHKLATSLRPWPNPGVVMKYPCVQRRWSRKPDRKKSSSTRSAGCSWSRETQNDKTRKTKYKTRLVDISSIICAMQ